MSSEVKRYWPEEIVGTGELVVYAQDYDALEAECARLRHANGDPIGSLDKCLDAMRDPAVIEASRTHRTLAGQVQALQGRAYEAHREAQAWREAHPIRAKAHDAGVMRAAYLDERAQVIEQTRAEYQKVAPQATRAREVAETVRNATTARIAQHKRILAALSVSTEQQQASRCSDCGYLTSQREHLGCLRKAVAELDAATSGQPRASTGQVKE